MIKQTHKLEMKKIVQFLLLFALLANGGIKAQDDDPEHWDMLSIAKETYITKGEVAARKQFDIVINTCSERIVNEARVWLQKQNSKSTISVDGEVFETFKMVYSDEEIIAGDRER